MGQRYASLTDELAAFVMAQQMFFVATAPLGAEGHINVSPKGLDSFRLLSPDRVAYLDLNGSGNETSAHLAENGRITFMFCAFAGPPRIVRLYGRGTTVLPGSAQWDTLASEFAPHPSARQIILADIDLVQSSCGFGVPLMEFVEHRDTTRRWAESKGPDGIAAYQQEKNARSLDGLLTPLGQQFDDR